MEQDVIDQLINRFAEKYPYKMAVPKQQPHQQQPPQHQQQPPQHQPQPPQLIDEEPIQHDVYQPQPNIHQNIPQSEPKSEDEILLNQLEQLEKLQNIEFPSRPQHDEKRNNMNFWLFVGLIIIMVGIIIYLIMRKR
jgi:hypothetical protein